MRLLRALAIALLTPSFTLAAPQNPQVSSTTTLPSVTAIALDRQKITLPADFSAPLNLLILFFQRDQQPVVEGWLPAAGSQPDTRLQTWMLPISQRENGLYRWWLNASFRGSQAATQPRHNTVPLYVDKQQFLRSLQVSSEQDVVVLLTDKSGRVVWRSAGPMTENKKADLNGFLGRVR